MSLKDSSTEQGYWNDFYEKCVIDVPSQFCVSMLTDISKRKTVVEFGSGNGRDSLYMASIGHVLVAMDLSVEAIEKCNSSMISQGVKHAIFLHGDMSNDVDVQKALAVARGNAHADEPELVIYSRFVMHSLDDEQEKKFLTSLSGYMKPGEKLYLEFRSTEDAVTDKYYGNTNHYRRYIDTTKFVKSLSENCGFEVNYSVTGQGMARYKEEDPFISRILATKK